MIYRIDGTPFDSGNTGVDSAQWKEFAKQNDQVWYYHGTNLADKISVDFVTEPGLLSDRHLITRLTENDGYFSFAAQIRLDFEARDENDELIWDATDVMLDIEALGSEDPEVRQSAIQEIQLGGTGGLLPPEGEFLVILIDALGGNDQVTIGPTVERTVWLSLGAGDDLGEILSGNPILVDKTEMRSRNDDAESAFDLAGAALIVATGDGPSNGQLSADATFSLTIGGTMSVEVTIPALITNDDDGDDEDDDNTSLVELMADINTVLEDEGIDDQVVALLLGNRIVLSSVAAGEEAQLAISADEGDPAVDELHLPIEQTAYGSMPAQVTATAAGPTNGQLMADASFSLAIGDTLAVDLTILGATTDGGDGSEPNTTLDDLVADLNNVLAAEGIDDQVVATRVGDRIVLTTVARGPLAQLMVTAAANDPAVTELHLPEDEIANGSSMLTRSISYTGLTIDSPNDVDWYSFSLAAVPTSGELKLTSISKDDGLTIELYKLTDEGPTEIDSGVEPVATVEDQLDRGGASNDLQDDAYEIKPISDVGLVRGLTIDDASDVDWFQFALEYYDPAELMAGCFCRTVCTETGAGAGNVLCGHNNNITACALKDHTAGSFG